MTFRPRFQESSSANPKQLSVLSRGKVDCTEAILCMMMTNNDPVIIILSGRPKHSVVMWRYVIVWRRRFDTLWYCSDVGIESLWNLREFYESFEFTLDSTLGKYFHPPELTNLSKRAWVRSFVFPCAEPSRQHDSSLPSSSTVMRTTCNRCIAQKNICCLGKG